MSDLPMCLSNVFTWVGAFTSVILACVFILATIGWVADGLKKLNDWLSITKSEGGADDI